jgi:hypothetical protein
MFVVCDRRRHRGQVSTPRVGQVLKCSQCGARQRFGESETYPRGRGSLSQPRDHRDRTVTVTRQHREIAGVVRFSDRRAAPIAPDAAPLNDSLDDLFERAGWGSSYCRCLARCSMSRSRWILRSSWLKRLLSFGCAHMLMTGTKPRSSKCVWSPCVNTSRFCSVLLTCSHQALNLASNAAIAVSGSLVFPGLWIHKVVYRPRDFLSNLINCCASSGQLLFVALFARKLTAQISELNLVLFPNPKRCKKQANSDDARQNESGRCPSMRIDQYFDTRVEVRHDANDDE